MGSVPFGLVGHVNLWPHQWPMVVQLTLALVIAELGQYWWHRLAHETDFLWRFHSTHHSPGRLYFLNTGRFHPIDMFVAYSTEIVPLVVLGAGADVIALWTLVTTIHGLFQHANTKAEHRMVELGVQHGGAPPLASLARNGERPTPTTAPT